MSPDILDRITEIAEVLIRFVVGSLWVLIVLFSFLASSWKRSKQRKQGGQPGPASTTTVRPSARTAPASPYTPAPASGPSYGTPYAYAGERDAPPARRRESREQTQPTYGSRDKAVWGSVFDDPGEESQWGFDESEWGSSFGPKKNSEPTITQG